MCGIFGIIPNRQLKDQQVLRINKLFKVLATLSVSRGTDAAGAAVINKGGNAWLFKDSMSSAHLVNDALWLSLCAKAGVDTTMWMGHTRAATQGANTKDNAHPFTFVDEKYGRIIGTHNGVVLNYDTLGGENTNVHDVDSACLFAYLSKAPTDAWGKRLGEVFGSYALAMYRDKVVHLVRDSSSPLFLTFSPVLSSFVYASTDTILNTATARCGIETKLVRAIPPNTLYSLGEGASVVFNIQPVVEQSYESLLPGTSRGYGMRGCYA